MFSASKISKPSGGGYTIARSVRLRSSASAYLNRTFSTGGTSRQIQTFSFWVKLGNLNSTYLYFFSGYDGSSGFDAGLNFVSNAFNVQVGGVTSSITTTQLFRDTSSWYHIVVSIDTTQATAANRVKIYVNGNQVTAFSTANYPAQNSNTTFLYANSNNKIGSNWNNNATTYFDGYITEFNAIDGQALTPSSFGSVNTTTGVWQPIKYTGTYGTNGFYLNFGNNASTTTLGYDTSGNSNNWTTNNISLTAGSTYDSMTDVPTLTSATVANYCVLNPLDRNTNLAPSDANLTYAVSGAVQYSTRSTIFPTSGKWYAEFTISSSSAVIGIANQSAVVQGLNGLNGVFAFTTQIFNNSGTAVQTGLASFAASDVISVAYDSDGNSVQFYRNNSAYGTALTPSATSPFCFFVGANGSATINANFGQRPFSFSPPSGYVALNTFNLP